MAEGTEVATRDEGAVPVSEQIRQGAGLSKEEWPEAKLAAVRSMLPKEARGSRKHMIAYLARAQRTGLDPFLDELYVWHDKGEIVYMTGRDGWLRLAKEDPNVAGLEFGEIHENDSWSLSQEGGRVMVSHQIGMPRGPLIGAYCVVHMAGEDMDAQVVKEMDDFSHLMGKKNWRDNPGIMAVTRCISEAVKLKCPAGAGIYSPEEWEMRRESGAVDREMASAKADTSADALAASLADEKQAEGDERAPVEAEATEEPEEGKEEDVGASPTPTSESEPDEPSTPEDSPEEDGGPDVEKEPCPVCTEPIPVSGRSRGGHLAGHTRNEDQLPDGYRVTKEGAGKFYFVTPDGEIKGSGPQDNSYSGWKFALKGAHRHAERQSDAPPASEQAADAEAAAGPDPAGEGKEEPEASSEPSTEPAESPDPSEKDDEPEQTEMEVDAEAWANAYKNLYVMLSEHDRGDDIAFVRKHAEKLFPDCVVDGVAKLNRLSPQQIRTLHEELEEILQAEE